MLFCIFIEWILLRRMIGYCYILWFRFVVFIFLCVMVLVVCNIFRCFVVILLIMWIVSFGFGKGWCYMMFLGRLSLSLMVCILFLKRVCNGLMRLNWRLLGSLLILWWFLILVVFLLLLDLMMLGYKVFCIKKLIGWLVLRCLVIFLKVWMNLCLMILCLVLGLVILVRVFRKCCDLLVIIKLVFVVVMKLFLICLVFFWCSSLWLMKM